MSLPPTWLWVENLLLTRGHLELVLAIYKVGLGVQKWDDQNYDRYKLVGNPSDGCTVFDSL